MIRHTHRLLAMTLVMLGLSSPVVSHAQVTPLGQQGCASGTVVGGPNLVKNGDFAIDAGPAGAILPQAGFTSELPNRGAGVYPDDINGGGFSIQRGNVSYFNTAIIGRPFPGDQRRDVPATETYFYSNPFPARPFWRLWMQTVTGLAPNTTYNFFAYVDNLLRPDIEGTNPQIELRVDDIIAGPAVIVPSLPDAWIPIQFSFTTAANQTSAMLEIRDNANNTNGDDFAITQINLKQCVSGLGIAKQAAEPVKVGNAYDITYTITAKNFGVDPLPIKNLQINDNLAQVFAKAASFEVRSLQSSQLAVNPAYDGRTDTQLLRGTDSLRAQQSAQLTLVVRLRVGTGLGGAGPFDNLADVSGIAGNVVVTDGSTPGTNPDPLNIGDPKSDNTPTRTILGTTAYLPYIGRP